MKFSMDVVTKMTGISAASLRNWEKRYGFPRPERSCGGHRFYTAFDVDFLKNVAKWTEEGRSFTELAVLYEKECKRLCPVTSLPQDRGEIISDLTDDVRYRVQLLYKALMSYDQAAALQHYQILNAKLSPEQLFDKVIEVILRRLIEDIEAGPENAPKAHFASAFLRVRLASMLTIDFPPSRTSKVITVATDPAAHEVGLLLVATQLKFMGFPIYYFGVDMCLKDVAAAVKAVNPSVVVISYVDLEAFRRDLPVLETLGVPVCVGGYAFADEKAYESFAESLPESIFVRRFVMRSSESARYIEMICEADRL